MKQHLPIRLIALAAAFLVIVSSLVACSSGSHVNKDSAAYPEYEAGGMEQKPSDGVNAGAQPGDGTYERKIIRTVAMSCETKAYDDAVSVIMTALADHNGYVEASSTTGTGYADDKGSARRAVYTMRVPAEKLDAFLETLRTDEGIRILSQDATSDEITTAYYDAKTRLETLNAEKAALTAMLEGFTDYKDMSAMLNVQERLYDVIEEMEALQTKLNIYDGQVALSTVKLTLREVITYTEPGEPTFGERISRAFTTSWQNFADGWQDFAVWFVEALPTLLVLGVIGGGIALIIVRSVKKRKK